MGRIKEQAVHTYGNRTLYEITDDPDYFDGYVYYRVMYRVREAEIETDLRTEAGSLAEELVKALRRLAAAEAHIGALDSLLEIFVAAKEAELAADLASGESEYERFWSKQCATVTATRRAWEETKEEKDA